MNTIKILIVDDHALFRMGLTSILLTRGEFEVVGDAADGATAAADPCVYGKRANERRYRQGTQHQL